MFLLMYYIYTSVLRPALHLERDWCHHNHHHQSPISIPNYITVRDMNSVSQFPSIIGQILRQIPLLQIYSFFFNGNYVLKSLTGQKKYTEKPKAIHKKGYHPKGRTKRTAAAQNERALKMTRTDSQKEQEQNKKQFCYEAATSI